LSEKVHTISDKDSTLEVPIKSPNVAKQEVGGMFVECASQQDSYYHHPDRLGLKH